MANISSESIRGTLAMAHERAKVVPEPTVGTYWNGLLDKLNEDKCPLTYLAVTCVLLTARAMHPASELNVLHIKQGTSPTGYSAPSIGKVVASFAKEHNIDLRASSSQPMNNQPFTFKDEIVSDMSVQANKEHYWKMFFSGAESINRLESRDALEILSYFLLKQQKKISEPRHFEVSQISWDFLETAIREIAAFVETNSDSGKVGQAFASGLLDLLYSSDFVEQGNSQDPDASRPGDVHVKDEAGLIWLWVEVKQAAVQNGPIQGFTDKVASNGGERVLYLALRNHNYPSDISDAKVKAHAYKKNIRLTIFQSPIEFLHWVVDFAGGTSGSLLGELLSRFYERLLEAGVSAEIREKFEAISSKYTE